MRGPLVDRSGVSGEVEFRVVAKGEGRGYFTLQGVGSATPWTGECPATGTLIIAPLLRFIRYDVKLVAPGGETFHVRGEKRPSLLEFDDTYSMFSTPLICSSIGATTVEATTSALAPGY